MKRILASLVLCLVLLFSVAIPTSAATTADVTVTATGAYVAISCDQANYGFGTVAASATPSTTTTWATVTNSSSVNINVAIAVTSVTWSGGVTWAHSDTATAGTDQAGLKSNAGGTWGVSDVIIKFNSPNNIENNFSGASFQFGLKLIAPSDFTDGVQKSNTVRLTASAA